MSKAGIHPSKVLLLELTVTIAVSVIVVLILWYLKLMQELDSLVLISVILFSLWTTIFSATFTGIASTYTILGFVSIIAGIVIFAAYPWLLAYLSGFLPGLAIAAILSVTPIVISIYIWCNLFAIAGMK